MSALGEVDAPAADRSPATRWWRVAVLALAALAGALTVSLAVTGISLSNSYRPNQEGEAVQVVHRTSAGLLGYVASVGLVAAIGWVVTARRQVWSVLPAAVLVGLVLLASLTGYLLPWDQVALWAVTVGSPVDGVWAVAFDDGVRFVLIGGAEVSPSTYRFWLVAHLGVVGALVVGLGVVVRQVSGRADA